MPALSCTRRFRGVNTYHSQLTSENPLSMFRIQQRSNDVGLHLISSMLSQLVQFYRNILTELICFGRGRWARLKIKNKTGPNILLGKRGMAQ